MQQFVDLVMACQQPTSKTTTKCCQHTQRILKYSIALHYNTWFNTFNHCIFFVFTKIDTYIRFRFQLTKAQPFFLFCFSLSLACSISLSFINCCSITTLLLTFFVKEHYIRVGLVVVLRCQVGESIFVCIIVVTLVVSVACMYVCVVLLLFVVVFKCFEYFMFSVYCFALEFVCLQKSLCLLLYFVLRVFGEYECCDLFLALLNVLFNVCVFMCQEFNKCRSNKLNMRP